MIQKLRTKIQLIGFFQLDLIALKKFWWRIRTNLGPKTPHEKILIYLSKKKSKADGRLIDCQRARARTEMEEEQENESQNSDHNIENLISEEAPKKKKDNNESSDNIGNNDDNDNYDYNDNNNVSIIVETSLKKKRRMDDDNDNSIKLSPEKNTKKSTKRMKEEIKIKGIRRSKKSTIEGKEIILSNNDFIKYKEKEKEKETFNNKKEPYYRIEKLPKEDKGKKGKKNLF